MKEQNKLSIILKGLLLENPVFVLVLGTCPTLATTTSVIGALSMGLAAAAVLICSNVVISLLGKLIPDKVRIPCYIVIIAGFVTLVQMLMHAYLPELYEMMGVYLALIVVNCIILGRAEMFARKNGVIDSALDGLGMGLGFLLALVTLKAIFAVIHDLANRRGCLCRHHHKVKPAIVCLLQSLGRTHDTERFTRRTDQTDLLGGDLLVE